MTDLIALRYPIGNFEYGKKYSINDTRKHIKEIAALPKNLKKAVKKLRNGGLEKPYRPNGWTARQVIHHLADSHMNAYIRMKLAVTENTPVIKPYEEQLWAEMEDGKHASAKLSLKLLAALHERWVLFLAGLSDDDLERGYFHPISKRTFSLQEAIALYAWHSMHHLAHIKIVADGKAPKFEKIINEEASKGKTKAATTPRKNRVMSEAHKEKIRAAHAARSAGKTKKVAPVKAAGKRGRPAAAPKAAVVAVTAGKRGRPAAAPKAAVVAVTAGKRGRPAAAPKAAVVAVTAGKRGRPAAAPKAAIASTRVRRTKEEVAAEKAAKAAAPKLSRAEVLAKARAARKPKAVAKPAKVVATPKAARSAAKPIAPKAVTTAKKAKK